VDIEYDSILGRWCLHYAGEIICLAADSLEAAEAEGQAVVDTWQ
jgi:hypothetical protein